MADPDIEVTCEYAVGHGDVFLVVTIGNGNDGTTDVFLDGELLDPLPVQDKKWHLGHGAHLKDKTLEIDSVVNPVTTLGHHSIVVTAKMTGGPKPGTCVAEGDTDPSEPNAPVSVQMLIDF